MSNEKSLSESQPWLSEPNEATWVDPHSSYTCAILRVGKLGHLCGYVQLPLDHPLNGGKEYFSLDADEILARGPAIFAEARASQKLTSIQVHGGITYNAKGLPGSSILTEGSRKEHYWIGFDCCHSDDLLPGLKPAVANNYTYRSWDFVQAEVTELAAQLKAFEAPRTAGSAETQAILLSHHQHLSAFYQQHQGLFLGWNSLSRVHLWQMIQNAAEAANWDKLGVLLALHWSKTEKG